MKKLPTNLSFTALLLSQLMVGVCIVTSKALLESMPPIAILTVRFIIAFFFLLILHFIFSKEKFHILKTLTRVDWFYIVAQALCAGALFNIFLIFGLKYTSASVAGIITSALPAIIAILSIIFLKERINIFTGLCILFSCIGLIIINAPNLYLDHSHNIWGDLIILISLLPEATYYVLTKIHKNRLPLFLVSSLMNGINIPVFLLILFLTHQDIPASLSIQQASLLFIVGIGSGLFYLFWFLGCENVRGVMTGLSTAFMPIGTLIIAWIFLNETISIYQFIGMLLVILSIFFNVRRF